MRTYTSIYIKNVTIYAESGVIPSGSVLIQGGRIAQIVNSENHLQCLPLGVEVIDGYDLNLIPGFIDSHIHGASGYDVMDGTPEALRAMAKSLPREGTTSFLATTLTQSTEKIEQALKNIAQHTEQSGEAELLGVHLEGPFINASQAGAQPKSHIQVPDCTLFDWWQALSGDQIKTVTIAPECDPTGEFSRYVSRSGVNVSAGHTVIGYASAVQAVENGVNQVTHLCNAMTGIHHREVGLVGAAFLLSDLRAEIIADGIHVSPSMLQLIYNQMGRERLMLVTDAMRAKGLPSGDYDLGGQTVNVTEDRATLASNGALAGSVLRFIDGAKNMLDLTGVNLEDVIHMTSVSPAKQLNVFDIKGSIAEGKDADLLLVDDQLNLKWTMCRGTLSYWEEI